MPIHRLENDLLRVEVAPSVDGELPLLGFRYERRMELVPDAPELRVRYRLENRGDHSRAFLWKLHAALTVARSLRPARLAPAECLVTTVRYCIANRKATAR